LKTGLSILQLRKSVTVTLEVSNAEGSASRTWSIEVPPTTTTTTTTNTTTTTPAVVLPGAADTLVEGEAPPPTAKMGLGGILGLIFGLLFGVILLAAAFFTCRPRERPKAINSRSSSKRNSAVFPPFDDKTAPLLTSKQPILRQGSGRRVDPTPSDLSTFGRTKPKSKRPMSIEDQVKIYLGDEVDNPGEVVRITPKKGEVDYHGVHAKARPDITLSSASLSSAADTDDLSSLGVPVYRPKSKDFHDPLGSWDDLEPELNNRRSHNFDLELDLTRTDISLTGPTGYPVMLPSPASPSSPVGGSSQRVHYHYPEGRERSMERKKSLDRTHNGRARSHERPHSRARTPTHI